MKVKQYNTQPLIPMVLIILEELKISIHNRFEQSLHEGRDFIVQVEQSFPIGVLKFTEKADYHGRCQYFFIYGRREIQEREFWLKRVNPTGRST